MMVLSFLTVEDDQVHKKQKPNQPEWKQDKPIIYSVDKGKMFFVNRSNAINQLHKIHKAKYERALSRAGEDWIIPLADNVIGLGKSDFGCHYIQKSRELWKDVENKTNFQVTLCDCHTIHITFNKGALLKNTFDKVMLDRLKMALKEMFNIPPLILSHIPDDTVSFLEGLVEDVGPVFIVLDEIGAAFDDDDLNDSKSREKFLSFCSNIVGKWLILEKVFFVLLGRGSFLSYVGLRPVNITITPSSYAFERLNIHLIRKEAIALILKNTRMFENDEKTIAQYFELSEEQLTLVSDSLFLNTNGHPRSLINALKSCQSFDELLKYNQPVDLSDWKLFNDVLWINKECVAKLLVFLEEGSDVNLTQEFKDPGGKSVTYDIIANNSFISWDGTVLNAKLYTHPFVKSILENLLLPFKEYLKYVGNVSRVSVDYSNVFEWMFLKRFQELFLTKGKPKEVLVDFFDTPVFGSLSALSFSVKTQQIPKITTKGNRSANLESETAHPDDWHSLMPLVDELSNICLKPRSKSASSDAFLITKTIFMGEPFKVTVGLAVKNFGPTEFTSMHLKKECDNFNKMFDGTDCHGRKNILFICCTKYHGEISSQFRGKLFYVCSFEAFKNIHEVVVLNLTTVQNRACFFDVKGTLSEFVENVVQKSEVEFYEQND